MYNKKLIRDKMKRIQSKLNKSRIDKVSKYSLSCFDDKRYIIDHDINSLACFNLLNIYWENKSD